MKTTRIAQRYAKALFELAVEQKSQHKVYEDMLLVSRVCHEKDFRNMLMSPIIPAGKKVAATEAVFGKKTEPLSSAFLKLIIRKKREYVIPEITTQFVDIYKKANSILTTEIQSAVALDKAIREQLVETLKKQTDSKQVELTEKVDDKLIGGFVLKYQNQQYDASIRKQLSELRKTLT